MCIRDSITEMIVGFPGFEISLALKAILQITAVNFFLYLAVLPIIALTCRRAGSFLVGVISQLQADASLREI